MCIDTKQEVIESLEIEDKREELKNMLFSEKLSLIVNAGYITDFKTGAGELVSNFCATDTILDILPPSANDQLDNLVDEIIIDREIKIGEQ